MSHKTGVVKSENKATPMECHMSNSHENFRNEHTDKKDDDPVVHEIPVFLAKSLAKQLFLYQVNYLRADIFRLDLYTC